MSRTKEDQREREIKREGGERQIGPVEKATVRLQGEGEGEREEEKLTNTTRTNTAKQSYTQA